MTKSKSTNRPGVRFDVDRCGWLGENEAKKLVMRIFRAHSGPLDVIVQFRTATGRWGSRKVIPAAELWPETAEGVRRERKIAEVLSSIPETVRTEAEYHLKAGRLANAVERARELTAALERLLEAAASCEKS